MENFNSYIINKQNLIHNVKVLRSVIGEQVFLCAVVKANAYGHGLTKISKIIAPYVDFFGVACVQEAKILRNAIKNKPILIFGITSKRNAKWCAKNNVSVTLNTTQEVEEFDKMVEGQKLKIHFKYNSGLNRLGASSIEEYKNLLKQYKNSKNLQIEGVFTHFATKALDTNFIKQQHSEFEKIITLTKRNIKNKDIIFHCSNSFATMKFKDYHHNMVRSGFNIYGKANYDGIEFLPVLTINSKLIKIFKVKAGDTISYDRSFKANTDKIIGVVPMGYADGFDRKLSNGFTVLAGGCNVSVVGYVCMDMFMVDLTPLNKVNLYDEVVILGKQRDLEITAQYYANYLNTTPYEIFLKFNYKRMNYIIK